jgi:hypothetical protein
MKRDRKLQAKGAGSVGAMKNWRYIALHTVAAAAFVFLLERYVLHAPLESCLLWALVLGGCAAGLAYSQSNR